MLILSLLNFSSLVFYKNRGIAITRKNSDLGHQDSKITDSIAVHSPLMISDWFSSLTKHDLAHIDNNWTMKNSHYKRSFRNRPHQPMIRKVDFRFLPFSIFFFLFVKLPYIAKRWYKNLEIDLTKPIIVLCWWWCCACSVNVIFFVKMSGIISAN